MDCSLIDQTYWDNFYHSKNTLTDQPSPFALFLVKRLDPLHSVIEIGCGNGRDAEFFSACGADVTACDASREAVSVGRSRGSKVKYQIYVLGDHPDERIPDWARSERRLTLYARFFLHAITSEQEASFLSLARTWLRAGDHLALEYRTVEDRDTEKVFGQHYRRFIDHPELCQRVAQTGFDVLFETAGRGLAVYGGEDPHVGRCIARRIER